MNNFLALIFVIIVTLKVTYGQLTANQVVEQNLVKKLFTNYSRTIRPTEAVNVGIGMSLKQIVGIDEKNRIMTTSCYISQLWYDGRLSWTPASYNNIEVLMVPLKNIWEPDTTVLNSADGDGYFKINSDFSLVQVNYDGSVYYLSQLIGLKTRCSFNTQNYPFDKQSCTIRITSWGNDDDRVFYSVNDSYVDLSDYTNNTVWTLTSTQLTNAYSGDRVVFVDSQNTDIILTLSLQRKPLYYMMNAVFPCLLLNVVTLLSFYTPSALAIVLTMVGFLNYAVYSLRIASDIPVQSDYLPKISWYFITSITYNIIAMLWYISKMEFTKKAQLPKYLDKFCGLLKIKVCCLCFDDDKKKDDKKENKEEKKKCRKCDRCADCETDYKKEKDKGKNKKDVEAKLDALNYLFFVSMLVIMFVSQIAIWTSLNN